MMIQALVICILSKPLSPLCVGLTVEVARRALCHLIVIVTRQIHLPTINVRYPSNLQSPGCASLNAESSRSEPAVLFVLLQLQIRGRSTAHSIGCGFYLDELLWERLSRHSASVNCTADFESKRSYKNVMRLCRTNILREIVFFKAKIPMNEKKISPYQLTDKICSL